LSLRVASCGGTKPGREPRLTRRAGFSCSTSAVASAARAFAFFFAGFFVAAFADAFPFFDVVTFSSTERFDCHTAPPALAMPSMVRRLTTERGFSSRMSGSCGPRAAASSDLISSHGSCRSPARLRMRTRCQWPLSLRPSSAKSSFPLA
jgi:hypothetical protein